jgi:EAL domain-containing protein (putative c-di-GMP-specific phosphodiesterase class I)
MGKLKQLSNRRDDRLDPEHVVPGNLSPVFQPILNLRTGRVEGFEALARLMVGREVLGPDAFVPRLAPDLKVTLFSRMLASAIRQLSSLPGQVSVSINVEASILILDDFYDLLAFAIASSAVAPSRVTLEILESEAIENMDVLVAALARLKATGVVISLDDIGSGYSSLMLIKDLPVDVVKLDRSFLKNVTQRPEDMLFVRHLQSLASSLGKRLIVEGVETPDMLDAMKVLGVAYVQGYAIAHPMAADAVSGWLKHFRFDPHWDAPTSLLGAYAFHLNLVETCRTLRMQPLPIQWKPEARNPHRCPIGIFFDRAGLHETDFGTAHKRFHEVLPDDDSGPDWMAGAARLKDTLREALKAEAEARHGPADGTPAHRPNRTRSR